MKSKIIFVGAIIMLVVFVGTCFAQVEIDTDKRKADLKKVLDARTSKPHLIQTAPVKTYDSNIPNTGTQQNVLDIVYSMPGDTVIAIVNDIPITKDMLMKDIWNAHALSAIDEVIDKTLILDTTKKAGVVVTEKEAGDELFNLLSANGVNNAENFFRERKASEERFISGISVEMSMRKFGEKNFKLDSEKLLEFVKASHILIKFDPNISDDAQRDVDARTEIEEIYNKIKNGEDFATLAKEFSEDGSANAGGSLGWFDKNINFVPEFKEAVFKLNPGEISPLVKTTFGYHIIKLDATGATASETELKDLIDKESPKMINNFIQQWYSDIKSNASVGNFIQLAPIGEITPPAPPQMGQ